LYGAFVWVRRALNSQKRWFWARAVAAEDAEATRQKAEEIGGRWSLAAEKVEPVRLTAEEETTSVSAAKLVALEAGAARIVAEKAAAQEAEAGRLKAEEIARVAAAKLVALEEAEAARIAAEKAAAQQAEAARLKAEEDVEAARVAAANLVAVEEVKPELEDSAQTMLPPGWERKESLQYAGHYYYTDGVDSQWEPPANSPVHEGKIHRVDSKFAS
jgi:hypothetical protein